MRSFIRNLSASAEFCLVALLAFGLPVIGSILVIARRVMNVEPHPVRFDDHTVIVLLLTEASILAIVLGIGRIRGWAAERFRVGVSWKFTAMGFFLYGAATAVAVLVHSSVWAHRANLATHAPVSVGVGLTLPFIILNSVTNPVFEEMLEAGYLISALHKFGMWPAILAGAFLRAFLHLYLGTPGALVVLVTGVIFGLVYWRWRQLWPLIVAHALLDFLGLMHVNIIRLLHLN